MTILTNPIVGLALFVFAVFAGLSFIGFTVPAAQVLSYVLITVAIAVVITYVPAFVSDVRAGQRGRATHLVGGITFTWIADLLAALWAVTAYITGWEWMRTSPIVGAYILLLILGGVLHITAPRDREGHIPARSWWTLAIALGGGLLIGLATVIFDLEKGFALSPI